MMHNLFSMEGKVCLITGGSSGLGSYMARGFLEAGASRVYITARTEEKLEATSKKLSSLSDGECIPIKNDLSEIHGVNQLSKVMHQKERHIDVVVHNAGIGLGTSIANMTTDAWDRTMDLNTRSPLFLTQTLLDLLKAKATSDKPSSIIFISSVGASGIFPSVLAYTSSKKVLEHATPSLALALADDFIRVNAIAPGRFISEMTRGAWQDPDSEKYKAELKNLPLHRYGEAEDIAGVAVMLCSRAGAYFHGEILTVDGGFRLKY